jgi:hypothetical protein
MLQEAQSELARQLDEACAHEDPTEESTAQLVRLEETLTEAAEAAKRAVSLRRRLRTGHGPADVAGEDDGDDPAPPRAPADRRPPIERRATTSSPAVEDSAVREFRDARGIVWRVWAVKPIEPRPDRPASQRLGEYSDGWLAFETEDGSQRRRLPHHPDDWSRQTNHALELLLEQAEAVRVRRQANEGEKDTTSR